MVKVTKNDILYYFENYKKLPIGWDEKKIKKARKKIKKKKESDIGEKLKKGELGPFITEVMTIVNILRKDKLSGDELNDKIDSLLKTPSPSLSPSPESLGSLKGLDQDEIEMELIKRDRQDMVDNYYKNHPDEKRITLRSVSPVRNSSKGSKKRKKRKKKTIKKKYRKSLAKKSKKKRGKSKKKGKRKTRVKRKTRSKRKTRRKMKKGGDAPCNFQQNPNEYCRQKSLSGNTENNENTICNINMGVCVKPQPVIDLTIN